MTSCCMIGLLTGRRRVFGVIPLLHGDSLEGYRDVTKEVIGQEQILVPHLSGAAETIKGEAEQENGRE